MRFFALFNFGCIQSFNVPEAEKHAGWKVILVNAYHNTMTFTDSFVARRKLWVNSCTIKSERKRNKTFTSWPYHCWR